MSPEGKFKTGIHMTTWGVGGAAQGNGAAESVAETKKSGGKRAEFSHSTVQQAV